MTRRHLLAAAAGASTASIPAEAQKKDPLRIIDPHVHVWTHERKYPWAKETKSPPEEDATAEMLLDLMRQNNVSHTVIIQVIHYRWDNSYVRDVLRKYPGIFHGVARVNPEDPAAPDTLSRLVKEDGFRGVRISPAANASGDWIKGPLMPPLWKRCEALKAPMTVLTSATRLPDVQKLIEKHPDLTVVIDHMADCPIDRLDLQAHLTALKRYPKVFVKISHTWSLSREGFPFRDTFGLVKKLYDAFGPQRLMWGTDWPVCMKHTSYAQALAVVRDEMTFLNSEDKRWILSRTVERVWPFAKG
jgi:predicted TIM-barrel fold metal-dependent hydrolase